MEVLKGIHKIEGVTGNVYILVDGDKVFLVDTGLPRSYPRIEKYLSSTDFTSMRFEACVMTHWHPDHVGCAARLRQELGVKLLVGAADAAFVSGEKMGPRPKGLVGLAFKFFGGLMRAPSFTPDSTLEDGQTVGPLRVIHTPGHTPGSLCLYHSESKTLFSGDALLTSSGNLRPPDPRFTEDVGLAMTSLRKLTQYHIENLMPGHGEPLLGGVSQALGRLLS
jgi:glyoxylase-like metal-dependent hydrolase (beta-lactamase superfamily II)